jgi:cytochrome c-type biogenesis protein CcmH/NrfF
VRRRLPWIALVLVVGVALAIGTLDTGSGARSDEERAAHLAAGFRCPTCRGQSVADSDAPAAVAIRSQIDRQIDEGRSDAEIRDYVLSRYPRSEQAPPRSGLAGLVWVLPVAGLVLAVAGLAVAFRRWRVVADRRGASEEDRVLVERARRGS